MHWTTTCKTAAMKRLHLKVLLQQIKAHAILQTSLSVPIPRSVEEMPAGLQGFSEGHRPISLHTIACPLILKMEKVSRRSIWIIVGWAEQGLQGLTAS